MQFGSNSLQHNNEFMYMKQIYVYALAHTVNEDKICIVFSQSMLTSSKLAQFFMVAAFFLSYFFKI